MKTRTHECSTCTYWDQYNPDDGGHIPMDNPQDWGWCRYNAPRAVAVDEKEDQREYVYLAQWPMTYRADWCGKWEPI